MTKKPRNGVRTPRDPVTRAYAQRYARKAVRDARRAERARCIGLVRHTFRQLKGGEDLTQVLSQLETTMREEAT